MPRRSASGLALAVPAASLLLCGLATAPATAQPHHGADCGRATTGATAYAQTSGNVRLNHTAFASASTDESAVLVGGGELWLSHSAVNKTGDTSDKGSSSFTGLNAAVLADNGGAVRLVDTSVTTNGAGTNGVFATGSTSSLSMTGCSITTVGEGAHGADATKGATLSLHNVDISTDGASSSAVATDMGGGTVNVQGGHITGNGTHTAGIYSTGRITVSDAQVSSAQDKGGVIDGANYITLNHTDLTGDLGGFMLWNTLPFREGTSTVAVDGGSVTATTGDLFYVTNTSSVITVSDHARLSNPGGDVVDADTASAVVLTADAVRLDGDIVAHDTSTVSATLAHGTALSGTVTNASLTLDGSSVWTVGGDSTLVGLAGAVIRDGRVANIRGDGHTVTYDATLAANSALGGGTYRLAGGGELTPAS